MARPLKTGLDYFQFYTNLFDDEKLFELNSEYGALGEAVYLRILCRIYSNGYYVEFRNIDNLALILLKSIGNKWAKKEKIVEIIRFLPTCELLDERCMEENVLTSKRIQSAWLEAMTVMKRKIPEKKEYWIDQ